MPWKGMKYTKSFATPLALNRERTSNIFGVRSATKWQKGKNYLRILPTNVYK